MRSEPFFAYIFLSFHIIVTMNKLKLYTIIGIIFVLITGTISHFVYEWSGNNFILGFFFPVNESTWEHMKLCFFPMLLYSFFMNRQLRQEYPCIIPASLAGVLLSTALIPVIFYTYSGILGKNYLVLDIATFTLSTLIAFFCTYRLALTCRLKAYTKLLKFLVLVTAMLFFVFTLYPPDINLFLILPANIACVTIV